MKKLDKKLMIYLLVLLVSWMVIIYYLVNTKPEQPIEQSLKNYPYEHSKITDSTLKYGK